jgi:hypothetical protein
MAKLKIPAIQMWDLLKGLQNGVENILNDDATAELGAASLYGILHTLLTNYRSGILTAETVKTLQKTLLEMEKREKSK